MPVEQGFKPLTGKSNYKSGHFDERHLLGHQILNPFPVAVKVGFLEVIGAYKKMKPNFASFESFDAQSVVVPWPTGPRQSGSRRLSDFMEGARESLEGFVEHVLRWQTTGRSRPGSAEPLEVAPGRGSAERPLPAPSLDAADTG